MAIERNTVVGSALVVAIAAFGLYFFLGRTPQVGPDDEAFRTLDALYTAITSRNLDRLAACETRLNSYREQGRLPAPAAARIDAMILQVRGGEWLPAAKNLHSFVSCAKAVNAPK